MTTRIDNAEWRAMDEHGKLIELPLAIELKDFTIDEYPPKLMLIDNETGRTLPEKAPEHLLLEEGVTDGQLSDWLVTIRQTIPWAASVATEDTVRFTEFHSMGATYAVYLQAINQKTKTAKEGWVSCGSFIFPYKALRLDSLTSLIMPEREPQRFASTVKVYTEDGKQVEDTIAVNHPLNVAGWNIYQLSYDDTKGRWSDISVFELVRDPWLPAVYAGIIMMVLGAICLFVNAQKEKRRTLNDVGLFCTVFNCRPALLGIRCLCRLARKKTVCCWRAYLDRTCYLLLLYCGNVDFSGASAYANHGRDSPVVLFLSSTGRTHHIQPLEV